MQSVTSSQKGFTLFELLIVILIIGLIYGVFVHKLQSRQKKTQTDTITLTNLDTALDRFNAQRYAEVICLEPCKECYIQKDGSKAKLATLALFKTEPTVYERDRYGEMKSKRFLPELNEKDELKDVCFRFKRYNNKSNSYFLVNSENKFYLYRAFLHPVEVF